MCLADDKARVEAALRDTKGNVTRAAMILDVSKPYLLNLVRRLELSAWASDLRKQHGAPSTGRPPNVVLDALDEVAYRPRKRRTSRATP